MGTGLWAAGYPAAIVLGGQGSGHFGHQGRPGKVGGSLPAGPRAGDAAAYARAAPAVRTDNDWYLRSFLQGRGDVTVYHVTMLDNVERIAARGLVPGAGEAPAQSWKALHSDYATYFHADAQAARADYRNAPLGRAVVIGRLPRTREMAARVIPDEDVSLSTSKGMYYLQRKASIAVIAGLEPEHVTGFIVGPGTDAQLVQRLRAKGYTVQVGGW